MLITAWIHFWLKGHRDPHNEVGSLIPAKHLVGFEPGTFQFLLQHLNPLGHSPQMLDVEDLTEAAIQRCFLKEVFLKKVESWKQPVYIFIF